MLDAKDSADSAADALPCKGSDVVPVEPDEKRPAPDMIVRNESPVTAVIAVVAIVAHHQVVARRHPAFETALIVVAILALRKIAHIGRIHRLRLWIDADRMLARTRRGIGALENARERVEAQAFEIAVRPIGLLRPRLAVHRQLLFAILDDVAGDADHTLDEILRPVHRITEHDDVATPRI